MKQEEIKINLLYVVRRMNQPKINIKLLLITRETFCFFIIYNTNVLFNFQSMFKKKLKTNKN
jgi:hypothetical protein